MRILQVCPYDWHAPGGVQTHVRELSAELLARGHDVRVLAPGHRPAVEPWVQILGRPVRVPFNGTLAPICPRPAAAWRTRGALRAFRPDLVHVHEPFAPSLGLYAGLFASSPIVATFHAHCDVRFGRALYACGTWPFNRRVAAGIAVSAAATSCLSPNIRVPFRVVPNGVDGRFFAIGAARVPRRLRRLLFAHRLEPRKGFRVAVAAFAEIAGREPDAELTVIGDGSERSCVEVLGPGLRARVRMRGTLSREDFAGAFADADVFLAPAVHGESFGIVLLEAMAAGLPVVASDVLGYRDVLRDGGGACVEPGDPDALAGAVTDILASEDLAARYRHEGRAHAARFTWPRVTDDVEAVYDDARRRPPPSG